MYYVNNETQMSFEFLLFIFSPSRNQLLIIFCYYSLKRPIYVSVFGHPSFTVSHFYVNIVARESSEEDIINLQLLDLEDSKNISSTPVRIVNECIIHEISF